MEVDYTLLYILYACTIISLVYIPRNKLIEASIIFLFQQSITWGLGIIIVGLHLVEYPVRELAKVNGTSFLYEFLLYPVISIFFCLYYPKTSTKWKRFIYIFVFCTGLTVLEVLFEKYTHLIKYIHWKWYYTWISDFGTLFLVWIFYKWYFKLNNIKSII